MTTPSDTHSYDNKLHEIISQIKTIPQSFTFQESIQEIIHLNNTLQHPHKSQVLQTINLFTNDSEKNYDPINRISVEDLLVRLVPIIKTWEQSAQLIFLEQLSDIYTSGSCPQGRCTRLIQLFP